MRSREKRPVKMLQARRSTEAGEAEKRKADIGAL